MALKPSVITATTKKGSFKLTKDKKKTSCIARYGTNNMPIKNHSVEFKTIALATKSSLLLLNCGWYLNGTYFIISLIRLIHI